MRRLAPALMLLISLPALAADFYVDPVLGDDAADGSDAHPWKTLQLVFDNKKVESQTWTPIPYTPASTLAPKNAGAPVKAGDTLWLRDGDHGALSIISFENSAPITLAAQPGHHPRLSKVLVRSSARWVLKGLDVRAEYAATPSNATLFTVENHSWTGPVHDVVVEGCTLKTREDVSAWTMADWDQQAASGLAVGGRAITIRGNRLQHVNFGISVSASDSLIEGNVVDSFSGDGLRGLGDNTVFQGNLIKNSRQVNANHCDGFQSWSVGDGGVGTGVVRNITLRGNTFLNTDAPGLAFASSMQGIGLFDGPYEGFVIENNVIITDHYHGISVYGARGCRVVNNTVIDSKEGSPGPPWIMITAHKNGTPPEGNLVRNNLATKFVLFDGGVVADHNLQVRDAGALFVDVAGFDLHLKASAVEAIDQGSAEQAPAVDHDGVPRPLGAAVDLGAYEWIPPGVDAGLGGGDGGSEPDAGSADGGGGGVGSTAPTGCGCEVAAPGTWWLALVAAGLLLRSRLRGRTPPPLCGG